MNKSLKQFCIVSFYIAPIIGIVGCSLISGTSGFFMSTVLLGPFISTVSELLGFKHVAKVVIVAAGIVWLVGWATTHGLGGLWWQHWSPSYLFTPTSELGFLWRITQGWPSTSSIEQRLSHKEVSQHPRGTFLLFEL